MHFLTTPYLQPTLVTPENLPTWEVNLSMRHEDWTGVRFFTAMVKKVGIKYGYLKPR